MRLGAPGLDVLLQGEKAKAKKDVTTIEEWVLAFNNFISVASCHSRIQFHYRESKPRLPRVTVAQVVQGSQWLEYDMHFRKQIATQSLPQWATIDVALCQSHS